MIEGYHNGLSKIRYGISFDGSPNDKLWNDGWRICLIWKFLKIYIIKYKKPL